MTLHRVFAGLAIGLCLAAPAMAAPKVDRLTAMEQRLDTLEKQNVALRADVDRLQKLLTQTRMDMVTTRGGYVVGAASNPPTIQPMTVPQQQSQANAIIQQQNLNAQMNSLQLQQNMAQDRAREQQLGVGATP